MEEAEFGNSIIETASNRITRQIRDDFASGLYMPGERLKIRELADRFGTSMMPVREALKQLEGDGLVELFSQKGAVVRPLDIKFIADMYDLRFALEALLVQRCIQKVTDADLADIEKLKGLHREAAAQRDVKALLHTNRNFHSRIRLVADNQQAYRIAAQGWDLINGLRARFGFGEGRLESIIKDHDDLTDAIRERDSVKAVRIAQQHCEAAKESMINLLKTSLT